MDIGFLQNQIGYEHQNELDLKHPAAIVAQKTTTTERLAYITSELGEAIDCVKYGELDTEYGHDGKMLGLPSECADILLAVVEVAVFAGFDLAEAVALKRQNDLDMRIRRGATAKGVEVME